MPFDLNKKFADPYAEGYDAYFAKLTRDACPYQGHTDQATQWLAGWSSARDESFLDHTGC
jgi:ribosome modulation factor